jgi:hypothetical protein
VLFEPADVVDDVAAGGEHAARLVAPAAAFAEGEVGIPDDDSGRAELAGRLVGEPTPGEPGAVPEASERVEWSELRANPTTYTPAREREDKV